MFLPSWFLLLGLVLAHDEVPIRFARCFEEISSAVDLVLPRNCEKLTIRVAPEHAVQLRTEGETAICPLYLDTIDIVEAKGYKRPTSMCAFAEGESFFAGYSELYHLRLEDVPKHTVLQIRFFRRVYRCNDAVPQSMVGFPLFFNRTSDVECMLLLPGGTSLAFLDFGLSECDKTAVRYVIGQGDSLLRMQYSPERRMSSRATRILYCKQAFLVHRGEVGTRIRIELQPLCDRERELYKKKSQKNCKADGDEHKGDHRDENEDHADGGVWKKQTYSNDYY